MTGDALLAYRRPSALVGDRLTLETSGGTSTLGAQANPRFFAGFLTEPEQGAQALLAVAAVARSRYFVPMTSQRLQAILDPVVTSDGERLRFESFSGCCGVYARYDVLADGLDGDVLDRGTTNVDVNGPLQEALTRVGGREPLHLSVGPDDLTVTTLDDAVVERRVTLPPRWVRGFAEVPAATSGMDLRAELAPGEARRFLRSLPRGGSRGVLWAVASGRSLRLTTRPAAGAVCLAGPERLAQLDPVLRFATGLRVYGPAVDGAPVASAWEIVLPGGRLTLTVSPDLSRGFSGEGGLLLDLADDRAADDADLVLDALAFTAGDDVASLAEDTGLPPARVRGALAALGSSGRVGYDVAEARWFHRQLPYDAAAADANNPRLRAARALIEENRLHADGDLVVVRLDDHEQHVRRAPSGWTCTCPWWARYGGRRGPCKHVLAARIAQGAIS